MVIKNVTKIYHAKSKRINVTKIYYAKSKRINVTKIYHAKSKRINVTQGNYFLIIGMTLCNPQN